ncbi:MAG: hypothetical protein NTY68_01070 [Candidatus Micrarchaeota archaeon]|nr:hypothetical protein [Candidatus Micrarchaeota archaeon]
MSEEAEKRKNVQKQDPYSKMFENIIKPSIQSAGAIAKSSESTALKTNKMLDDLKKDPKTQKDKGKFQ